MQQLVIGEVLKPQGIRGELKIKTYTDFPEDVKEFKRVFIDGVEYKMESCRVQKTCNLVKLSGIDTMEAAQTMRGKVLELYREDIDDEVIFADELLDMEVFSEGESIGKIVDVLDYPGNKVYVVKGEHDYMIPAVKAFVISTDLDKNEMQVRLIEGMRSDEN